ncbi:MAG: ACP S-malonyltransferase [Acetobacteraceae bacterium]|nr:ACP S-malonyltransferase [Acetobacteraceae bacterium]
MPVRAFVFPGQGSQAVGMGQELARAFAPAREVFEEVDEALASRLSRLIWEGPIETLTLTENAQPALLAVSIAVIRTLAREGGLDLARHAKFVAGHSLGEYCALAAAGTFGLADAARLLRLRGQAMQKAVPAGEGGMAALLGAELDLARAIAAAAAEGQVCSAANDNGGGQVVLSGHAEAIGRAIALAPARGVKRAMKLPVSAPFHCALMQPAAEVMQDALAAVAMAPPAVPVLANVSAEPESDPIAIRGLLVEQVTALVRWRESVLAMRRDGVDTLVECGAGKVLSGLARRIDPELAALSVGSPAELEAFARTL